MWFSFVFGIGKSCFWAPQTRCAVVRWLLEKVKHRTVKSTQGCDDCWPSHGRTPVPKITKSKRPQTALESYRMPISSSEMMSDQSFFLCPKFQGLGFVIILVFRWGDLEGGLQRHYLIWILCEMLVLSLWYILSWLWLWLRVVGLKNNELSDST